MGNTKQLGLAVLMYTMDNQDRFPKNQNGGTKDVKASWVAGWIDWSANNSDNTNLQFLVNAMIGPYTKNVGIYRCPADIFPVTVGGGRKMVRVRSVAMNGFIEGGAYGVSTAGSTWYSTWRNYNKLSDVTRPSPSQLWMMNDEHPDSINDGWEIMNVTDPNAWVDLPASYHSGACGFNFADGHSEIKKWLEKSTLVPVKHSQYNGFPAAKSRDIAWIIDRSSAKK